MQLKRRALDLLGVVVIEILVIALLLVAFGLTLAFRMLLGWIAQRAWRRAPLPAWAIGLIAVGLFAMTVLIPPRPAVLFEDAPWIGPAASVVIDYALIWLGARHAWNHLRPAAEAVSPSPEV